MKEPTFLKTIRVGNNPCLEEILERKRHNSFWIDKAVIPAIQDCKVSDTQVEIDLFCSPCREITGDPIPSMREIYSSILSAGFTLCTVEMGLLAYPLKPNVDLYPQERIRVAMEPLLSEGRNTVLCFSESIPMDVDVENRRIFTHPPIIVLELASYNPDMHGIGCWIFARQHRRTS